MVEGRTHRMTEIVARLAPGATLEQARSRDRRRSTPACSGDYTEAYDPGSRYRVAVIPFKNVLGERARLTLWLLMGAAAFVMIISAANVANLTLMRGVRREHELVVRAALGAGAGRLRRLLLAENLVLTLLGAALGMAHRGRRGRAAHLARRALLAARERDPARRRGAGLRADSVGDARLAALLRRVAAEGRRLRVAISAGARRTSGGLRKQRLQRGLVVVQVAVSVVLLAGAGLLTRTMIRLAEVDTGLTTEEVLTMQVPLLTDADRSIPAAKAAAKDRYERMRSEIAALPGVVEVGVGSRSAPPLGGRLEVKAEGKAAAAGVTPPRAEVRTANPEFFRAAGIPLLQGRAFASTDGPVSAKVVIINQTLANQLFPGEDPMGRRIAWTGDVAATLPAQRRLANHRRRGRQHPDGGLDAEPRAGGLHAVRAAGGARRKPGDPGRQQRRGPGGCGDAHRAAHRADSAHRERDDRRAVSRTRASRPGASMPCWCRRSASWR